MPVTELPASPDDLTADWLSETLGIPVTSSTVEEIHWGTATKVRLRVEYAEAPGPDGPPQALCVKGGFDERLAGFDLASAYQLEGSFYRDLAHDLDARVPRSWFAAVSASQGVVILDDLAAAACIFGEPTEPWAPDRVAAGLEVQAAWHGPLWGTAPDRFDWLDVGSTSVRAACGVLLGEEHWNQTFGAPDAPALPDSATDRGRVRRAFERLWELDDSGDHTLAHGDAHIGNTYIDAEGQPGFLDWQAVCLAPNLYDVAYFIGGALSIADRREHERALLQEYLAALAAAGGPSIGWDEAWRSYVHHTLHGFLWAVTPPVMQSPERIAAMAERHLAAIDDHDVVAELGV